MRDWFRREIAEIKNHKKEFLALTLIVAVIILLRLPSLFEPYWYGDEGVYLTIGHALSHGLILYRDIHDNKPPFIYLLAMGANSQPMFRAYLLLWTLAGTIVFWKLLNKIFSWPKPIYLTLIFGLLTSFPLLEGNIANGENFFLPLTVVGMFCTWQLLHASASNTLRWAALTGLAFSLGSLFKIPAAFDGFAAGLIILCQAIVSPSDRRRLSFGLSVFAAISALPWALVSLLEYLQGAWPFFLRETLLQNISYLSTWHTGSFSFLSRLSPDTLTGRLVVIAIFTTLILIVRKSLSSPVFFASVFFLWALFGTTLSGRPYAHYFLQIVPAATLLIGALFNKIKPLDFLAPFVCLLLLIGIVVKWHPWVYPVLPYYQNFLSFITGRISPSQYISYFDLSTPQIYTLAHYLQQSTLPDEKIFLWGDWSQVYALSHRLPVGRYTTAYHITDFDPTREETLHALNTTPPRIIITLTDEKQPFPGLYRLLAHNYTRITSFTFATVYQLANPL